MDEHTKALTAHVGRNLNRLITAKGVTVEELAEIAFPGKLIERKHLVSVRRAWRTCLAFTSIRQVRVAPMVGATVAQGISVASNAGELCGKVGDGVNQAADLISATASIPSLNFIPLTTFGNWF